MLKVCVFKTVDLEPSSSASVFHTDFKKRGDLGEMLDSSKNFSKDSFKLDAMKRIISMLAKVRVSVTYSLLL
jgi:hypothetical protein